MNTDEMNSLYSIFRGLFDVELALSKLYNKFSQIWPKDKRFWLELAREKTRHANFVLEIAELLIDKPEKFSRGSKIEPCQLDSFKMNIELILEKADLGMLTWTRALMIAKSFESYFLESGFLGLIKTDHKKTNEHLRTIAADTKAHEHKLEKAIEEQDPEERHFMEQRARYSEKTTDKH